MEATATTREKIIYHALKLFAAKGYSGVSMREIAAAVGIQGASLYNHFKGKEDIFNAIFAEMTKQYDAAAVMFDQVQIGGRDFGPLGDFRLALAQKQAAFADARADQRAAGRAVG